MSRVEDILKKIIDEDPNFEVPQSRIEELLIVLAEKIGEMSHPSYDDIKKAVDEYLSEHPVTGGATEEEHTQIYQNKADIEAHDISLHDHDARIHTLERELGKIEIETADWDDIIDNIDAGYAHEYYPVGTQIVTDYNYNGTNYSCPQNIVDHKAVVDEYGDEVPGVTIEWEYTIPVGIAFDPGEAFYCVGAGGMAPGTYHFTVAGDSWASQNGKVYQFTVTDALTEGMHLKSSAAYNKQMTEGTMQVFADGKSFTALYSFPITEGSGGTDLGTMGSGDLNHYHRMVMGYNNWKQSFMRQWLNASGLDWWEPQNKFDRAPTNIATLQGFLTGYGEEFLSKLKPVTVKTYRNTLTDDGGIDITQDKVFIASFANWNINTNQAIQFKNGEEGKAWEYYEKLAEGVENLDTNGAFKYNKTYPQLIRYALNNKTSAQYVFSRSANRTNGHSVFNVYTSGNTNTGTAYSAYRIRPACVIRK